MAFVFADLMNGANARMVESRGRPRFPPKSFKSLWIAGCVVWKEFKSDETSQESIFGLVDDTHSASTEQLNNPVVGDGLTDH
jgi:hypothetical protein